MKAMKLVFDEVKATQAAAAFLRLAPSKSLNFMALIKLLYMADREAIRRLGLPITTDHYVSMKHGPVASRLYDRMKPQDGAAPTFWSSHIKRNGLQVSLEADPDRTELSPAEERIINEVYAAEGHLDGFALAEKCHQQFPEWTDPGPTSRPLDITDIVTALGLSEDEAANVAAMISLQRAITKLVDVR